MRTTVEQKLTAIQLDNEKKLEQMRATVDEKLHATLEQRLGESFKQVADRLDQVHRGLGEMQVLAKDVGSLEPRAEQRQDPRQLRRSAARRRCSRRCSRRNSSAAMSRPCRAATRASTSRSSCRAGATTALPLWLPIDAKFPREDYERLLDAQERADPAAVEVAGKAIEMRLRAEARTIREKYIAPPHTADFGILFVPTEGLYAEALRRPGLVEALQREHKIMLAGPTTLLATLNSLQMGFRTLALEKRSAEVWEVLGAVKTEFGKFGEVLAKTQQEARRGQQHDRHGRRRRTRVMTRELKSVEALSDTRTQVLLPGAEADLPTTTVPEQPRARRTRRGRPSRTLIALIVGQICLHSCMAGVRMAAPLQALRQGHVGLGGRCAARAVRGGADRCSRCRPGGWPTATATTGRCAWRSALTVGGGLLALCCRPGSRCRRTSSLLCAAAMLTGAGCQRRPDHDPAHRRAHARATPPICGACSAGSAWRRRCRT